MTAGTLPHYPTISRTDPPGLKVAVLVDLLWRRDAGGQVKCWERLAEAATAHPELDLTVHFEGEGEDRLDLSSNVRYLFHRPVFSTARLGFLSHISDHADLSPWQPHLARHLDGCALVHTTDAYFAFAMTAERLAARRHLPLVHSIHTDTPGYTRLFASQTIERLAGDGRFGRFLNDGLKLPERGERAMLRRLARHERRCRFVFASRPADRQRALAVLPPDCVRTLRRGVDRTRFSPKRRDRERLHRWLGVPPEARVVVFAGRMDCTKSVMVLAEAVRRLIEDKLPVHLLCLGDGADRARVCQLLGMAVTCPGNLPQDDLAWIYASADVLAQPSQVEVHSNVVQEALSSGLPAVSASGGGGQMIADGWTGGMVSRADPAAWAEALRPLLTNRALAARLGRAARSFAETRLPSWDEVLTEDLLPVWYAASRVPCAEASPSCWHRAS